MDQKKKKTIVGSTLAKIIVFILLGLCSFLTVLGVGLSVVVLDNQMYLQDKEQSIYDLMSVQTKMVAYRIRDYYVNDMEDVIEDLCDKQNIDVVIKDYEDKIIFQTKDEQLIANTEYAFDYHDMYLLKEEERQKAESNSSEESTLDKVMTIYINDSFPYEDNYYLYHQGVSLIYDYRYAILSFTIAGILIILFSFLFLMCSAGHKNGKEGITGSILNGIPFDLFTMIIGAACVLLVYIIEEFSFDTNLSFEYDIFIMLLAGLLFMLFVLIGTLYAQEIAIRLKKKELIKNTLIYRILRWTKKILGKIFHGIGFLLKNLPMVLTTLICFLGISILEFLGILIVGNVEVFLLWLIEKCILFPIILYVAILCKRLQETSAALAEGDLSYKVDTSKMVLGIKEHGENLNQIGLGMTKAVEERMRSERLKTELITNVSHDLKTPLTSIINYADLLGSGNLEEAKVAEYAEVLHRQSKRLKKLLEDLVEASKATTGNLEVHLERCEVGVLLTQAAGEYEQRMLERHLTLLTNQPQEPVYILADGRHLWRVFDNLMNNINKYAQENSRVYLSLEVAENYANIIFRNMSEYPLEISGEEYEERFVRGDKSRHMEGSGLGLSIAKSLVELQQGTMKIVTDGDLFKVILSFQVEK